MTNYPGKQPCHPKKETENDDMDWKGRDVEYGKQTKREGSEEDRATTIEQGVRVWLLQEAPRVCSIRNRGIMPVYDRRGGRGTGKRLMGDG